MDISIFPGALPAEASPISKAFEQPTTQAKLKMSERKRGRPRLNEVAPVTDENLLDVVLESFGENGFDGTSVREIARGLGVSHNLIPQRFGSKKSLWYAAVDYGFGAMTEELMREATALGEDDLDVLRGVVIRFIEINAAHPSLLKIIAQEASRPGPRLDYLFDTFIKPNRDFGQDWLESLAENGRIRPTSVVLFYFMLTQGAAGPFSMPALAARLSNGEDTSAELSIRAQAEMAANVIFDGLLVR